MTYAGHSHSNGRHSRSSPHLILNAFWLETIKKLSNFKVYVKISAILTGVAHCPHFGTTFNQPYGVIVAPEYYYVASEGSPFIYECSFTVKVLSGTLLFNIIRLNSAPSQLSVSVWSACLDMTVCFYYTTHAVYNASGYLLYIRFCQDWCNVLYSGH